MRGKILPGGHLPLPRGGKRVRLLLGRVILRERFAPLAVQLNVTDRSRRSPGKRAEKGCESMQEVAGMPGEWGSLVLIAAVVLVFLFAGGGGG